MIYPYQAELTDARLSVVGFAFFIAAEFAR
jgi:hypothetical protein